MATEKKSPRKANLKPGDVIVTPTGAYEVNKDGKPIKMSEANRVRAGFPPGDTGLPVSNYQRAVQIDSQNRERKKDERKKTVKKVKAATKPKKASKATPKRRPR
jgi:ssDNA-binding Zn-finger/Zn-ribbon topoisomerase 1